MTTIVTRAGKGSPLTHTEVDTNFTNLNTNKLEAGAIALGSAATPSISFTGDTNTGIYSPGADQVAVATNGTQKLIVLSNGNVGIGTSSPAFPLHISTGDTSSISEPTAGTFGLYIQQNTSGSKGGLCIQDGASNSGPALHVVDNVNNSRFIIDTDGNVGIGTTSPGTELQINATTPTIRLEENSAGSKRLELSINSSAEAKVFATQSGSELLFGTVGTERARIDSSGRLLVGTIASPAHQLQVSTDSAGKPSTNTWTIVSDERIKEEIELADLDLCYQAVKTIPLKRFKWKDEVYTEEQVRDRRKLGWIAQDVEAVFPKAVGTYEFKYNQVFEETIIPAVEEILDDEGNVTTSAQPERIEKGELISEDVIEDCRDLNSDQLYAAMYGAIQKLMVKVETLEAEVVLLKAQ